MSDNKLPCGYSADKLDCIDCIGYQFCDYTRATPEVSGEYAREIITEALRIPSEKAIERNKKASELVKKLKG